MHDKKYVIGKDRIIKVNYEYAFVKSKGGRREPDNDSYHSVQGKHSKQNYIQRRKKRARAISELLVNNFEPGKLSLMTLTFDDRTLLGDYNIEICKREVREGKRCGRPVAIIKSIEELIDAVKRIAYELHLFVIEEKGITWEKVLYWRYSSIESCAYDQPIPLELFKTLPLGEKLPYCEYSIKAIINALIKINSKNRFDIKCNDIVASITLPSYAVEGCYHHEFGKALENILNHYKLTRPDVEDLKYCNKKFKHFIQKLNYLYDGLNYVGIPDRQQRGAWHYHIFCNLPHIPQKELMEIWGNGGVNIRKITRPHIMEEKRKYITKKIYKSSQNDFRGEKAYLNSKGLLRYIIARSWSEDEEKELYEKTKLLLDGKEDEIIKTYTSHNVDAGTFTYNTYNIGSDLFPPAQLATRRKR